MDDVMAKKHATPIALSSDSLDVAGPRRARFYDANLLLNGEL
jgi:hypothetical protein